VPDEGRWLLALFVVSLALNLLLLYLYHRPEAKDLVGDEVHYFAVANRIAAGEAVQPDPLWPTLPSKAMGSLFAMFGPRVLIVQAIQIAMWLASAWFFYRICRALLPLPGAALIAVGLYLLSPELMGYSHLLWPEVPHLFLFLAGLQLLIDHGNRNLAVMVSGALFALAILTKLVLIPLLPVVAIFLAANTAGGWGPRSIRILLFTAVIGVCVTPTLLENREIHGRVMIADSTVFNAWVGLNDVSPVDYRSAIALREHRSFRSSADDPEARNRIYRRKILELVREKGVIGTLRDQLGRQYFRLFHYETMFTTQLPGGPRSSYRFESPLLVALIHGWAHLFHALVLGAGVLGLCFLRVRRLDWLLFLPVFGVVSLGGFLVLHVKTRYLLPHFPLLMLFSGAVLAWALARHLGTVPATPLGFAFTRRRLAAGLVLVACVEFLAFGSPLGFRA
jgi:hypothetical protein